ncbi:hypothetical protein PAXRUDRAFT_808347 [Paxillus rubicundulus Ve08.2h10]|uniref:Uncharacterized protein n=1 Tax=Paxillus rubicundulus Ve08.2h10 TaxID=930991 RepID=A0A0D0DQ55_9AGAM|nr:hypothetical protein PAXRUDRAFT_808347 [Paxillus rubicundulus Ve08.2h10]
MLNGSHASHKVRMTDATLEKTTQPKSTPVHPSLTPLSLHKLDNFSIFSPVYTGRLHLPNTRRQLTSTSTSGETINTIMFTERIRIPNIARIKAQRENGQRYWIVTFKSVCPWVGIVHGEDGDGRLGWEGQGESQRRAHDTETHE